MTSSNPKDPPKAPPQIPPFQHYGLDVNSVCVCWEWAQGEGDTIQSLALGKHFLEGVPFQLVLRAGKLKGELFREEGRRKVQRHTIVFRVPPSAHGFHPVWGFP